MSLGIPILCIDYSLAPAAPFPRALQEVYWAYAWALKNKHALGKSAIFCLLSFALHIITTVRELSPHNLFTPLLILL